MRNVLDSLDECSVNENNIVYTEKQRALIQAIEQGIHKVASPLQRLEHDLHIPISLLILPIFALANAAIPITAETVSATFSQSTPISIIFGLTLGKCVGITAFTYLAIKTGISVLPTGCNMKHIVGVSFLGGIGFTMSIFITDLAFVQHPELIDISKLAILVASIIAGMAGLFWLRFIAPNNQTVN
jgi:NhaA family Na+:H+ antiporter